jgi:hypothetical protein
VTNSDARIAALGYRKCITPRQRAIFRRKRWAGSHLLYVATQIANRMAFVGRFYHAVNVIRWRLEPYWLALRIRRSRRKARNNGEDHHKDCAVNHDFIFAVSSKRYLLRKDIARLA